MKQQLSQHQLTELLDVCEKLLLCTGWQITGVYSHLSSIHVNKHYNTTRTTSTLLHCCVKGALLLCKSLMHVDSFPAHQTVRYDET
jgi:hypothetical protein